MSRKTIYLSIVILFLVLGCGNSTESEYHPCFKEPWSEIKVVEGEVTGYSPMDEAGHGSRESFLVNNIPFNYTDYMDDGFYNNSCVKGGLICSNGQYVRIKYRTKCEYITGIEQIEIISRPKK
jgi:hypothetical protein